MRSKEEAHDYRYFPDPDLPPVVMRLEEIAAIKAALPELPWVIKKQWQETYELSEQDAAVLVQSRERAQLVEQYLAQSPQPKSLGQFLVNKIIPFANEQSKTLAQLEISSASLNDFLQLIADEKVSASMAYQKLFPVWITDTAKQVLALAEQLDLIQSNDNDELATAINTIIEANPKEAQAFRKGKKQLLGFFMGELMKAKGGKVNPKIAKGLIEEMLNK